MHFNEFFLGLEHVSALTHMFDAEFRADLTTVDDKSAYAYYRFNFNFCLYYKLFIQNFTVNDNTHKRFSNFKVADASDKYRLSASGYKGTAGEFVC